MIKCCITAISIAMAILATHVRADQITDEIIASGQMMSTVKTLGFLCLSGKKNAAQLDQDKMQVRQNLFWAFWPDVHLMEPERKAQSEDFDNMWDALLATSRKYNVDKVSFVGCDTVALVKCLDMYYVGITPRGPVLFKFSMMFGVGDYARLMNIETITQWDKVKEATKAIEHRVDRAQVPTISWPKSAAATQPLRGGSKTDDNG